MISVTYTKENMLMNKQQFDMNIQAADNNSLRIGAANRIVQLLQKLRYSNNENSAKRWVWELCQNAKDVCNSTGKVKISINYDEIIYIFLTIFLYLLKCPQSLILSALRAFFFCGKPHISRSIFLYFLYQTWLKSW